VKPGTRELLSLLASNPKTLSIGVKIPVAGIHFLVTSFHAFTPLAYGSIWVWYAAVMEPIIIKTRYEKEISTKSMDLDFISI